MIINFSELLNSGLVFVGWHSKSTFKHLKHSYQTLFACCVGRERSRMWKLLPTMFAQKWLLACVNSLVFLFVEKKHHEISHWQLSLTPSHNHVSPSNDAWIWMPFHTYRSCIWTFSIPDHRHDLPSGVVTWPSLETVLCRQCKAIKRNHIS